MSIPGARNWDTAVRRRDEARRADEHVILRTALGVGSACGCQEMGPGEGATARPRAGDDRLSALAGRQAS